MPTTRVLIAVKTYPTLSEKYDELVCTAGFLEDGTWIRIYPIPFRKLSYDKRYSKWQWIELDLVKNTSDFRKESFRPANIDNEIKIVGEIGTKNGWAKRKSIVLKHVRYNMAELIEEAKNPQIGTSLAVFKPQRIIDFVWEESTREWDKQKLDVVYANQAQHSLFDVEETKRIFKVAKKLPYEFSYKFISEDELKYDNGVEKTLTLPAMKFLSVRTWDKVRDYIRFHDDLGHLWDERMRRCDTERVGRVVNHFQNDDNAYFMVINAPNTEVHLITGEIGICSLLTGQRGHFELPRVSYQTSKGNVVLFPDEIMPVDINLLQQEINEGYIMLSDGRYLPPKEAVQQCYNAFGIRVGLGDNWEDIYDGWNKEMK